MAKKLVIIDDSSTQLNILKTHFTKNGWEVCGVQNAKIGYEIIFDFAPDLIITDAIMPLMGGFQLVKLIRENKTISRIPVIVYSVLNENNAKFYINEELSEYFLKKDNNHDELLKLAQEITDKFPLDKEYKDNILRAGLENYNSLQENKETIEEPFEEIIKENKEEQEIIEIEEKNTAEEIKEDIFNFEKFKTNLENTSNFSLGDEKIFSNLFALLHKIFNYDLAILNAFSFENMEKKSFFDIRNIILSPIFKNFILQKYETKSYSMQKKYAPNLNTVINESEFLSKIEFNFEYKNEFLANIIFYSCEKLKWENFEDIEKIKELLFNFLKTRHIQKGSQVSKKEDFENKYNQTQNEFNNVKNSPEAYFTIAHIENHHELTQDLSNEELDILYSKISEQIIQCLDKDEQIYKTDEDDYNIVIYAKDEKQIRHRIDYIANTINEITYNNYKAELFFAIASCNINNDFNIIEAQKNARKIIEEMAHQENMVIYNE